MGFNDFIKGDFIPEGDGQVAPGSASILDPVSLETDEQTLQREQNERDVLEALGNELTNKPRNPRINRMESAQKVLFFFSCPSQTHMHICICSRGLVSALSRVITEV